MRGALRHSVSPASAPCLSACLPVCQSPRLSAGADHQWGGPLARVTKVLVDSVLDSLSAQEYLGGPGSCPAGRAHPGCYPLLWPSELFNWQSGPRLLENKLEVMERTPEVLFSGTEVKEIARHSSSHPQRKLFTNTPLESTLADSPDSFLWLHNK